MYLIYSIYLFDNIISNRYREEFRLVEEKNFKKAETIGMYDKDNNFLGSTPVKIIIDKGRRPNIRFEKGTFFTMSKRITKMLKNKKNYNNLTFRLLFELLERIEFENRIKTFRQTELARDLDSKQSNISVSLKLLEADNIIKKVGHDYYFSKEFVRYASSTKDNEPLPWEVKKENSPPEMNPPEESQYFSAEEA
jgi:hypothetical protein